MSISENIKKEINELEISDDDKKLLMNFLEVEDNGRYRYKKEYEKIVKKYLSNKVEVKE